ncbi:MAG TPA: hypothetical protein P5572_00045 [Phycisphaerae bacterium]|nr:hypothetical protein [Phycisphaerae bacterium]
MVTEVRHAGATFAVALGLTVLLGAALTAPTYAQPALDNGDYRVTLSADGIAVTQDATNASAEFTSTFTLLFRADNPGYVKAWDDLDRVTYLMAKWTKPGGGTSYDYFEAAAPVDLSDPEVYVSDGRIVWVYPSRAEGQLLAVVSLPAGGPPRIDYSWTAAQAGYASIVYTGAPAAAPADADEIWQPQIWNERRFPGKAYLSPAYRCTLPGAFVVTDGVATGVMIDPAFFPYQPLPVFENSQFGVLLRDPSGNMRSMTAAPILGGPGSQLAAGAGTSWGLRLIVHSGNAGDAFEYVARTLFDFHDYRANVYTTTNQTLANMIDYALGPYAQFDTEYRGASFQTDVPGSVKNVSAVDPLSVALVTDNAEVYTQRARPIWEFLLSRKEFLFAPTPDVAGPDAWLLEGPCARPSEFATLHAFTRGQDFINLEYARQIFGLAGTPDLDAPVRDVSAHSALALYDVTGLTAHLNDAVSRMQTYINNRLNAPATDWSDPYSGGMLFFYQYVPLWQDLYRFYEVTHDANYLTLAHAAAREFAMLTWMAPRIPADEILVNPGGFAPVYAYLAGGDPIPAPEEWIPAWWVSEVGLVPEASDTSHGHRGIFLSVWAPDMLRLAHSVGDDFLRDVARASIVGRYSNFPGYHLNTARTNVYMQPDYPLRPFEELTYNSFHYTHVWPQVALMLDWLISDAEVRSDNAIHFPSRYVYSYAYFFAHAWGDRAGDFYGDANVWLWMPSGLLDTGDVQIDYLSARGNDRLYVALLNQSDAPVTTTLHFDPAVSPLNPVQSYAAQVRRENGSATGAIVSNNSLAVDVAPKGITALTIESGAFSAGFQQEWLDGAVVPLGANSYGAWGVVKGMLLSLNEDITNAYIYASTTSDSFTQITLHYRTTGDWNTVPDTSHPFEYSIELAPNDASIEFYVEGLTTGGSTVFSNHITLER